MTNPNAPADAGGAPASPPTLAPVTTPAVAPAPADPGSDYFKGQMKDAIASRDAAKTRARELEAELAELKKPKADAGGDPKAYLAAIEAERDGFKNELATAKEASRKDAILRHLMSGLPEDRRAAMAATYSTYAAQLDDGEAEPAEIAKQAEALLKQTSPFLFEPKAAPAERGRLPQDGGPADFNAEQAEAEFKAALQKTGATGHSI